MKKRVVSLLLCLIMALSLIPTAAFATEVADDKVETQSGADVAELKGHKSDNPVQEPTYGHIDVRVAGTLTITKTVNGVATGTPQTVNVTVSNVSATVNDEAVTNFYHKRGTGDENEWRADKHGLKTSDRIAISCTLKINSSNTTVLFIKTYTEAELKATVQECPGKSGFDIDITAKQVEDTITKTVGFFTANKDQGLLNTDKEKVTYENLVVGTAFPETPTTNAKDGYEFEGWYAADATGKQTGTEKVTTFPATVTDDAYYVAVWKTKAPTTRDITVTKNWVDPTGISASDVHPASVTVNLMKTAGTGKTLVKALTLTATENWKGTFENVLINDTNGNPINYTVEEVAVSGYTYAVTGDAATGFIVTNTLEKKGETTDYATLTIKKVDEKGEALPGATFALYNGTEEVDRKISDENGLCAFETELRPMDANYTLKEVTAPEGYVTLDTVWKVNLDSGSPNVPVTVDGKLTGYRVEHFSTIDSVTAGTLSLNKDETGAYVITNTRATGNLTIEKEVDGIDNVTQEFQFKVCTVNGTKQELYGTYTATIAKAAEIKGLPTGQYFVTEVADSADISGYSRETTYHQLEDLVSVYSTTDVNGIYVEVNEDDTATVSVINTYTKNTANLVITKTLNEALPVDMTFGFNVMKGTDPAIIGAEITIKAGETSGTAIVENLTVGKTYTVQEVEKSAQLDGYTVVIPEAQKVTISGVATKDTVTFENVYTKNTGTLTISKVLKGDLVATDFDKPFTFTIWQGTTKKDTVEVRPGNPVTLTLNPGMYTIVEDKADVEGYDLTTSFAPDYRVEVKAGEDTAVVATNTYTKTVTPAPEEHTFTIDITKNIELLKRTSRNPGKASFTFEAYMVDEQKNVTVLGDVTIETRGTKSASGKLTFTLTDEQLTYGATVYVREVEGNARGWTYDDTIYELKIGRGGEILTGDTDLTFTNVYYRKASSNTPTDDKTVKSVKTGDMGIAMYAMTSLLSLGGAALVIKKRKDEK